VDGIVRGIARCLTANTTVYASKEFYIYYCFIQFVVYLSLWINCDFFLYSVGTMSLKVIQKVVGNIVQSRVPRGSITHVSASAHSWIAAHPGRSGLLAINSIVIFAPGALIYPFLAAIGFGASGPIAGELL
jgi:hypothetical protein